MKNANFSPFFSLIITYQPKLPFYQNFVHTIVPTSTTQENSVHIFKVILTILTYAVAHSRMTC